MLEFNISLRHPRAHVADWQEKPLHWRGSSYDDLCAFPEKVRRLAGHQLGRLQLGVDADDWKPISIVGSGTVEVRIRNGQSYRIMIVTKFEEAIYVLHAFEKRSAKTSKGDIELAARRYRYLVRERGKRDEYDPKRQDPTEE